MGVGVGAMSEPFEHMLQSCGRGRFGKLCLQ